MRIISITTLILIMLALLTSCTQVNGEEPLQAIVDSPCDPPCWQYIIPGKTSKQEMVELTSRIPEINKQKSEWIGPWNIYNDRYVILFEGNQSEGQIRFIDDEVVSIFLYNGINLNIERALDLYGEPDSFIIEKEYAGDVIHLSISILYLEEGILLNFTDGDLNTAHIQPGKQLRWVVFLDPGRLETLLTEGAPLIDPEAFQNNQYPWKGYENIKFED